MKVSSARKVEMAIDIPDGVHIGTRRERGDNEIGSPRNVMRIWSRSAIDKTVAIHNVHCVLDAFREALEEK